MGIVLKLNQSAARAGGSSSRADDRRQICASTVVEAGAASDLAICQTTLISYRRRARGGVVMKDQRAVIGLVSGRARFVCKSSVAGGGGVGKENIRRVTVFD